MLKYFVMKLKVHQQCFSNTLFFWFFFLSFFLPQKNGSCNIFSSFWAKDTGMIPKATIIWAMTPQGEHDKTSPLEFWGFWVFFPWNWTGELTSTIPFPFSPLYFCLNLTAQNSLWFLSPTTHLGTPEYTLPICLETSALCTPRVLNFINIKDKCYATSCCCKFGHFCWRDVRSFSVI